ncbi:MAG: hypothetical protein C7B47_14790 [Sulfobacillus thermosulfidooxidans]|uniref:Pyruvate, water dikinase n=1 Tax=Sulfobacillus thermosulfidooxidans TaxID=28034 RepID=A0A2T2WQE2_SULTH|nr:MAG: hypothetical protein C7B47_14790 [Sulfobacillus thermosulfidooxidans]
MMDIVWLGEPESRLSELVGGKVARLARIAGQCSVPLGFCVTTDAYRRSHGVLTVTLQQTIAEAYCELARRTASAKDAPVVAVRSSALAEDGEAASFAGQYTTYLGIVGTNNVVEAVQQCWDGSKGKHIQQYQADRGLPPRSDLAVFVQLLVPADVAGIAFSADPSSAEPQLIVNASLGLGDGLASGTIIPDVFTVDRATRQVTRSSIAEKALKRVLVNDRILELAVAGSFRWRPSLTSHQVREVAELTLHLEQVVGYVVDIEFAYADNRLFVVQCRPATFCGGSRHRAVGKRTERIVESSPLPAQFTLSKADLEQHQWAHDAARFPAPLSPMFASLWLPAYTRTAIAARSDVCYEEPPVKLHHGYVYYRADWDASPVTYHTAEESPRDMLQRYLKTEIMPFYARMDQQFSALETLGQALPLVRELECGFHHLWKLHFDIVGPIHALWSEFNRVFDEIASAVYPHSWVNLMGGVPNKLTETDQQLSELAAWAYSDATLEEILRRDLLFDDMLSQMMGVPVGRCFIQRFQAFLSQYGYRSSNVMDLLDPTWIENPQVPLNMIKKLMQTHHSSDMQVASAGVNDFLAAIPNGPDKRHFVDLYNRVLDSWAVNSDHHFFIDAMLSARTRLWLLTLGNLMCQQALLNAPDDILFLTVDELKVVLQTREFHGSIRMRRLLRQQQLKFQPDPLIGLNTSNSRKRSRARVVLRGMAAVEGMASGWVRIIAGDEDLAKLSRGDIVVCKTFSPSWTPVLNIVRALVADTGGILSHFVLIAREYGVPCVVATERATQILHDGQRVRVDGNRGLVQVLPKQLVRLNDVLG